MQNVLPAYSTRTRMSPRAKWFGAFVTLALTLSVVSLLAVGPKAVAQVAVSSSSSAAVSSSVQPAAASQSAAGTQSPCAAQTNELLDDLLINGTLTRKQYDALKEHNAERCAAQEAAIKAKTKKESLYVTASATGIGFHTGNFDVALSGEVNGFYIHNRPYNVPASDYACLLCETTDGGGTSSQVSDGIIPGWLMMTISTHQGGWDESVNFGVWASISSVNQSGPGVNFDSGASVALGNPGIDFRQQFLTVSRHNVGTFKVGRDWGMIGQEAILNDMALFGVGTVSAVGANSTTAGTPGPGEMAAGRIGSGYIYLDFMPQITYTTPDLKGFSAQAGAFQPLSDAVATTLGATTVSAPYTGNGSPMFQFKLNYSTPAKFPVAVKLWSNYLVQKMSANASDVTADPRLQVGQSIKAYGMDYGGKLDVKGFSFVAYGYNGKALGTTAIFFAATSPSGVARPSHGYYVQGLYIYKKWTVGVSDGMSALLPANAQDTVSGLVRDNALWIGQVRYSMGSWASAVAEFDHNESESSTVLTAPKSLSNTNVATSDAVAVGVIAWF